MPTWSALQAEFQNLREPLRFHRLDFQWGAAGEYFRIAGGPSSPATTRFELLAEIAGAKLTEIPPGVLHEDVLNTAGAQSRWYEVLRYHSDDFHHGIFGWQTDDEGNHAGNIFTGTVNHPVEASANLALRFSALASVAPAQSDVEPKPLHLLTRMNKWLRVEKERRGYFWAFVGAAITIFLGVLAL